MNGDWQRHVLACSGYLELGMFDDAAMVPEEIAPEDRSHHSSRPSRNRRPGAGVESFWETAPDPLAAILRNVKGSDRRKMIRDY